MNTILCTDIFYEELYRILEHKLKSYKKCLRKIYSNYKGKFNYIYFQVDNMGNHFKDF